MKQYKIEGEIFSDSDTVNRPEEHSPGYDTAEAQIQRHFITLDSTLSTDESGMNALEIYKRWKEHKKDSAIVKERELYRHHKLMEGKRFIDEICEVIFASLLMNINNSKNLLIHFNTISNNFKEFAKKVSQAPETLGGASESYAGSEEPIAKFFSALTECDKNFAKEAVEFAAYIDSDIIPELQENIKGHNSRTQAYRNEYPKLFISVENTEKKILNLFKSYTNIVDNNELHILTGKFFNTEDSWVFFHQYTLIVEQQKVNLSKYGDFCESLIEIRKDLETVRVSLYNKSIEKVCKGYQTYFGKQDIFNSVLSSVLSLNNI